MNLTTPKAPFGIHFCWRNISICAALILVTLLIYFRTIHFGFVDYDDSIYVSSNAHVQSGLSWESFRWALTASVVANWHPLTLLVFLFFSSLFGPTADTFHILNFAIHSLNVALFYIVLFRITRSRWQAVIATALWGWHPLRVESVAWISELKDVLCGFFWLSCILTYAHYRTRPTPFRYGCVALSLILALLAKPMAVTLPLVLLLLDFWPLSRGEEARIDWKSRFLEKVPLLLLSIVCSVITAHFQHAARATAAMRYFPMQLRFTNALTAYISYLAKTFVPIHLGLVYPHPAMLQQSIGPGRWGGAVVLLLLITVWAISQRHKRPYLIVGWLWFFGTLVPVIGIVQVGEQAMADRYTYFPSMGLCIAVVWFIASLAHNRRLLQQFFFALSVIACALLTIASYVQVGYWRDSRSLFSHSYQVIANDYLAVEYLSSFALSDGNQLTAIQYGRQAVELAPLDPATHETLAQAFQAAGQNQQASREFKSAIKLNARDPVLRNEFGGLLMQENRTNDAIDQFREAIRFDPNFLPARQNLAMLLATQGKYDQAIAEWKTGLTIEPHNGTTHGWLAEALRITGEPREAVEHYRAAIAAGERNPTWETNLAWLVATNPNASPEELEQAVSVAKDASEQTHREQPGTLDALATALARLGRFDDAVINAQAAAAAADAQNNPRLAADIRTRLNAYRAGQVYIIQDQSPVKP